MLNPTGEAAEIPLIVQVEGILLRQGYVHEQLIHSASLYIFSIPYRIDSLLKGRGWINRKKLDDKLSVDLLLDEDAVSYVNHQRALGRNIFLVSRLPEDFVKSVYDFFGGLSGYIVLDSSVAAGSEEETALLREHLASGAGEFELVTPAAISEHSAAGAKSAARWTDLILAALTAIRVRQWSKNVLVFVPVALAMKPTLMDWFESFLAFLAFSFVASISYIINDLLDLQADRSHPSKKSRPFASGTLPVRASLIMVPLLLIAAIASAYSLHWTFQLVLGGYFILTCVYSIYLKRMLVIDVVTLGCLYAIRVIAGREASGQIITEWLVAFSVFLFLALALLKRQAELATMLSIGRERAGNRSYLATDFPVVTALAASAAFNAVTVFAVFISVETTRGIYSSPQLLWLAVPVLVYWLSRLVILTSRGKMNEDPIVFAFRDAKSLICGLAMVIIVQLAH